MEKYLKDTYGITVYQEQVMLLSRLLADFTRGESDALRKAMGKKKKDIVDAMKPKFIEGGMKNGHDPKILEKIWSDWEKFASYAFNKSHAVCYAWVAYQTAYLKAHYPAEYMAAVLSRSLNNVTELAKQMDECKAMGIKTLGPDVNESHMKFSVNKEGNIRYGLAGVKGVGETAVQAIINERKNGPFKDIFDFVKRVNLNVCNKKNMECLALSGGFDSFNHFKREQYVYANAKGETFLDTLIRFGIKYQMDKQMAQNSLFGGENVVEVTNPEAPEAPMWSDLERLDKERELVGIYLSAHPLDEYRVVLEHVCNTHMDEIEQDKSLSKLSTRSEITMGGLVTAVRRGVSKKGNPYGIVKIEDYSGSGELPFWGDDWAKFQGYLYEGTFVYIHAKCQPKLYKKDELELKVSNIELLPDVKDTIIEKIVVEIPLLELNSLLITEIEDQIKENHGNAELFFKITDGKMSLDLRSKCYKVNVGNQLLSFLEEKSLNYSINN